MVNQKCSSKQVITAYIYSIERNKRDFFWRGGGGYSQESKSLKPLCFSDLHLELQDAGLH